MITVSDAFDNLQDMITDYYDDLVAGKMRIISTAWHYYAIACLDANRGYFSLRDVMSETLEHIPPHYPEIDPLLPIDSFGQFVTKPK